VRDQVRDIAKELRLLATRSQECGCLFKDKVQHQALEAEVGRLEGKLRALEARRTQISELIQDASIRTGSAKERLAFDDYEGMVDEARRFCAEIQAVLARLLSALS
jgi:hypothetical protein